MKQKILALALMLLVLTGCSGKKTEPVPTAEPTLAVTEPTAELGALITAPSNKLPSATTVAPAAPTVTQPVPPPTAAPTAPPAIIITKHPSSETVSAGARTWFIANAENETQITWEFFSPDGTMYSLQQTISAHPGLILEVLPKDTLGLQQIPVSFSGWSARARYDGPGGTAVTDRATITVRESSPTNQNPPASYRDPYGEIIEIYRSVYRSGTGNFDRGVSELVNPYDFLGYTLQDLDGNGINELILASDEYNTSFPNVVYAVYTLRNNEAVCVFTAHSRQRYYWLVDDTFLLEGSSSAASSHWIVHNLNGTSLSIQEQVLSSDQPNDMADFAPYFYYSGGHYSPEEPITYDIAARTIENWERMVFLPVLTPIN